MVVLIDVAKERTGTFSLSALKLIPECIVFKFSRAIENAPTANASCEANGSRKIHAVFSVLNAASATTLR